MSSWTLQAGAIEDDAALSDKLPCLSLPRQVPCAECSGLRTDTIFIILTYRAGQGTNN